MQAIVEFRKSVYGPVLAEYNVAGRGHNHIQEKCASMGSDAGLRVLVGSL